MRSNGSWTQNHKTNGFINYLVLVKVPSCRKIKPHFWKSGQNYGRTTNQNKEKVFFLLNIFAILRILSKKHT